MKSPDQKTSPVAATQARNVQGTDSTNKTSVNKDDLPLSERLGVQSAAPNGEDKAKEVSTQKMLEEISNIQQQLKAAIESDKEGEKVGDQVMEASGSDGEEQLCRRKRKMRVLQDSDCEWLYSNFE